ncbi:MAG: type II secretion system protein [Chloroflexi bacterium]|nr:type II secretion system protein [Chloroflexota bacterium]
MFKINRKNRGFTLLELMVVMGIMAVLAAVVFPAVTGVKGSSAEAQVKSDADAVQKATDSFNNKSIKAGVFPETTFGGTGTYAAYDSDGVSTRALTPGSLTTTVAGTYTKIDWAAAISVWLQNGAVASMGFVPNFLGKQPESSTLKADEDGTSDEFLWLLRQEGAGAEVTRKVEVYRLKPATEGATASSYMRLY